MSSAIATISVRKNDVEGFLPVTAGTDGLDQLEADGCRRRPVHASHARRNSGLIVLAGVLNQRRRRSARGAPPRGAVSRSIITKLSSDVRPMTSFIVWNIWPGVIKGAEMVHKLLTSFFNQYC